MGSPHTHTHTHTHHAGSTYTLNPPQQGGVLSLDLPSSLSLVVLQPSDLALLLRLLVRRMQLVDLLAVALAAGQVRPRAGEGGAKGRNDPREQLDKQEQHGEGEERQGVRLEHGVDAVLDNAQTGALPGDALLHKCLDEGGRGRTIKRRRGKYSLSLAVEVYMMDPPYSRLEPSKYLLRF